MWLLLLAPPLPPVLLASTSALVPLSSTLAEIAQEAGAVEHAGRTLASCTPLVIVVAGGVCTSVRSCPGLISRAMGERDKELLPWRTPVGAVLRCAPLAAESAQGARGRSPLQPGSPGAPALLDLVRCTPMAALPVGRIRA